MKKQQAGFTLIELVVVIVILGILAATALPKFINLSGEAADASAQGVVGAINSASSINYAAKLAGSAGTTAITTTTTCANLSGLLESGLPDDVTIEPAATALGASCVAGFADSTTCGVKHTKGTVSAGTPIKVTIMCTGP